MDMAKELPYLFGAFMVIWVGISGYLYRIASRQKELQREIDALNEALKREEKDGETEQMRRIASDEAIHII